MKLIQVYFSIQLWFAVHFAYTPLHSSSDSDGSHVFERNWYIGWGVAKTKSSTSSLIDYVMLIHS